jgi:hypothetical protein
VVIAVAVVASALTIGAAPARRDGGAVAGAHACVSARASARGDARVAWKRLRNPIFALDHMSDPTRVGAFTRVRIVRLTCAFGTRVSTR